MRATPKVFYKVNYKRYWQCLPRSFADWEGLTSSKQCSSRRKRVIFHRPDFSKSFSLVSSQVANCCHTLLNWYQCSTASTSVLRPRHFALALGLQPASLKLAVAIFNLHYHEGDDLRSRQIKSYLVIRSAPTLQKMALLESEGVSLFGESCEPPPYVPRLSFPISSNIGRVHAGIWSTFQHVTK